jgi:hypothetical protein
MSEDFLINLIDIDFTYFFHVYCLNIEHLFLQCYRK